MLNKSKYLFKFLSFSSPFLQATAPKITFFFTKCSKKMVFPKKSHWNTILLVLSGKMIFFDPENRIVFFRLKMKDDLSLSSIIRKDDISLKEMKDISQKKYMEILFFKEAPAPS